MLCWVSLAAHLQGHGAGVPCLPQHGQPLELIQELLRLELGQRGPVLRHGQLPGQESQRLLQQCGDVQGGTFPADLRRAGPGGGEPAAGQKPRRNERPSQGLALRRGLEGETSLVFPRPLEF